MAEVIGGLAGSVQGTLTGLVNKGQSFIDQWFPPERRADLWARFQKFLNEKPMLASFLLSHIAISGLPLLLFIALTLTVGVFSLVGGLLVGLLGALLFVVVAVGFALLILLPTLFFTTLVASFLWLWGLGTYYILKYFNKKDIPGIHTDLGSALGGGGGSENEKLDALNGRPNGQRPAPKLERKEKDGGAEGERKPAANGSAKGGKSSGVDLGQGLGEVQKRADLGNATKSVGDAKGRVDGVTKSLPTNGVTDNLPVDGVAKGLGLG